MTERAKEVISMVEKHTGITYEQMCVRTRLEEIVFARQIAMYALRRYTPVKHRVIASYFGGYNHSTIIHAVKTIDEYLEQGDKRLRFLNDFWNEKEAQKRIESSMISQLHNIELVDMAIHNIKIGQSSKALAYLFELQDRVKENYKNGTQN